MSRALSVFNKGHTAFKLGKPLKNLCSAPCLLSRSYYQHFKIFHSTFPIWSKMWYRHAVFSILPFSRYAKTENGTTYTCIMRRHSTVTCATALFQAGNDSADSTLPTRTWCQPRNYLIAPHTVYIILRLSVRLCYVWSGFVYKWIYSYIYM
jgi:hypothetical protein